jgi:hypothetical protein
VTLPALDIADLIRTAGAALSNETASGSVGGMSKCCWPLRGVVRLRSAGISMSAPAAPIVLRSRINVPSPPYTANSAPIYQVGGI